MMGEQAESAKYGDILSTAKELFWKHGVRRVTIEEICREAGVSKMTFYRFFPNKIELAKTILQNMADRSTEEYKALMAEDIPFEEKVRRQLLMKFEGTKEMSMEFVKDLYSNREWGLREYMEQRTEEALTMIMTDYRYAQEQGWIRRDIRPGFILYMFHQMSAWVSDEQLLAQYGSAPDLIMEIANFFFYGILPHPAPGNE